jgi:acyl-CoA synthetase (AMP-forming)/AMP-acid ligase II
MSTEQTNPQPTNWLAIHAAAHPEKPVAISRDRVITWGELQERSRTLAKKLYDLGLRPGDKAALMTYNRPEYFEVSSALECLNVGRVMVGYRMKAPEIEYVVDNSDSRCLFFDQEFAERILPHRERYRKLLPQGFISIGQTTPAGTLGYEEMFRNPPEVDLGHLPPAKEAADSMIYTSGTTGKPKGAARKTDVASRPGVRNYVLATIQLLRFDPNEVHLICCPLYHSAPSFFSLVAFIMGGTLVLQQKWNPEEFLRLVDQHGVTSTHVVPTQLAALLRVPEVFTRNLDLSSMRSLICGAAPLFPQIKLAVLDRFGPVLHEYYGSTETGLNTIICPDEIRERPASVGKAFACNELKILDDEGNEVPDGERGILYMYNEILMDGYYKNEEATRETYRGKHMTVGDVAIRDEDGYIYIVDRVKDMIIRGGVNIYPAEIEEVLLRMAGIRDAAVVGKPDPEWGETVAAFVVRDESVELSQEVIAEHCGRHMANQKIPTHIVFADEIPRTPTGKILKRELKQRL